MSRWLVDVGVNIDAFERRLTTVMTGVYAQHWPAAACAMVCPINENRAQTMKSGVYMSASQIL